MRRRHISRLATIERRRTAKTVFYAFVLIAVLAGVLFYYGVPLLIRMAVFMASVKNPAPQEEETKIVLASPVLDALPEATPSAKISVTGFSLANTTVAISVNGEAKQSEVSHEDGSFSVPISLMEGENLIVARAHDDRGNESRPSTSWTVTRDSTPPGLNINSPGDHSQWIGTDQKTVPIEGKTDSDAVLSINGRLVSVGSSGQFSSPVDLHEGDNTIDIIASDKAGNHTNMTFTVQWKPG